MSDYKPTYEFFETLDNFKAGEPDLVATGDRFLNMVKSATFDYHRHGGCLGGTLTCVRELLTFIEPGWFIKARLLEEGDTVYSGVILDPVNDLYQGVAQIKTIGLISWMKSFLRDDRVFYGEAAATAILELMETARIETFGSFRPSGTVAGVFPGTTETAETIYWAPFHSDLVDQIRNIATYAADVMYGFFPEQISPIDGVASVGPADFQVIQGVPPKNRILSIGKDVILGSHPIDSSGIINDFTLYGDVTNHSWREQNRASIKRYGSKPGFAQIKRLADDAVGEAVARAVISLASNPYESWKFVIQHSNSTGDTLNLIETGLPFPWKERIVLRDLDGAQELTSAPARACTLNMGAALSMAVEMGTRAVDIENALGLDKISRTPLDIPSLPVTEIDVEVSPPDRKPTSAPADLLANEPPTAFYLRQKIHGGMSEARVAEGRGFIIRHKAVENPSLNEDGTPQYTSRTETVFDEKAWFALDSAEREAFTTIINDDYRAQVPSTGEFRRTFKEGRDLWAAAEKPSLLIEVVVRAKVPPFFEIEDTTQDYYLDYNRISDMYGWGANPSIVADTVTPLINHWDETGEREAWNKANATVYLGKQTGRKNGAFIKYQIAGDLPGQEELAWIGVPRLLAMHLGGTLRGKIPGTPSGQSTYDFLINTYGGEQNIYSVLVERFPYEVTFNGPPSGWLPDGFANRAAYFTETGAAEAISRGYYWDLVTVITPIPGGSGTKIGEYGDALGRFIGPGKIASSDTIFQTKKLSNIIQDITISGGELDIQTRVDFGESGLSVESAGWPVNAPPFNGWQPFKKPGNDIALIRVKRQITNLTKLTGSVYRDPEADEKTASLEYGLRNFKHWEYRVRRYDDDDARKYVDAGA